MKTIDEYFDWWLDKIYPHASYVNALGNKWTKQFALDWSTYVRTWGERRVSTTRL